MPIIELIKMVRLLKATNEQLKDADIRTVVEYAYRYLQAYRKLKKK